jgi:hypothetical protein
MDDALLLQFLAQGLRGQGLQRDPHGFPIDPSRPIILNPDGSFSTERSQTAQVGRRYYNYPSIWEGQQLDPDAAYRRFIEESNWGRVFPNFETMQGAEAAAVARSRAIATMRQEEAMRMRQNIDKF